ncbi:unnamed protein product [Closterium sp. NIES-64]|nr:unnamed protein product [Closterium sp. NIES-64]
MLSQRLLGQDFNASDILQVRTWHACMWHARVACTCGIHVACMWHARDICVLLYSTIMLSPSALHLVSPNSYSLPPPSPSLLSCTRRIVAVGATVGIDSDNSRDALFRAAINTAFSAAAGWCTPLSSLLYRHQVTACLLRLLHLTPSPPSPPMATTDIPLFLACLAAAVRLPSPRALTMVLAALAARTRSSFLQAWVRCSLGIGAVEAEEELQRLASIATTLPPSSQLGMPYSQRLISSNVPMPLSCPYRCLSCAICYTAVPTALTSCSMPACIAHLQAEMETVVANTTTLKSSSPISDASTHSSLQSPISDASTHSSLQSPLSDASTHSSLQSPLSDASTHSAHRQGRWRWRAARLTPLTSRSPHSDPSFPSHPSPVCASCLAGGDGDGCGGAGTEDKPPIPPLSHPNHPRLPCPRLPCASCLAGGDGDGGGGSSTEDKPRGEGGAAVGLLQAGGKDTRDAMARALGL